MSLQKNVSVELCELYLDSSSSITSAEGATVSMQETTLALGSDNTTLISTTLDCPDPQPGGLGWYPDAAGS